jgi:predicted nucleic acid-binding protein
MHITLSIDEQIVARAREKLRILAAIDLHRLYGFSLWDTLVLRMAGQSGRRELLTEDMQHDQRIDGVWIVHPFL